jgi:glucan phosphoethanolaminetransferase (alkaline phosphatase superfamily)
MIMVTIIATILLLIFLFLAAIHFYWVFGGQWGKDAVIPTNEHHIKVLKPGPLSTFIVAVGLLIFGVVVWIAAMGASFDSLVWLHKIAHYGLWIIAGIFFLRAMGDFRYVGFFKKHKQTKFGMNDTKYYSPLCLTISLLTIILALMSIVLPK